MTCNVFGGTLSLTQSINHVHIAKGRRPHKKARCIGVIMVHHIQCWVVTFGTLETSQIRVSNQHLIVPDVVQHSSSVLSVIFCKRHLLHLSYGTVCVQTWALTARAYSA